MVSSSAHHHQMLLLTSPPREPASAGDSEAAPEADKMIPTFSKNVSHNPPLSAPPIEDAKNSYAVSNTDLGPTNSANSEGSEEATVELEPAVEDTAATIVTESCSKGNKACGPQTFAEALQGSDAAQCKLALDEEVTSLQENGTYTLERWPLRGQDHSSQSLGLQGQARRLGLH